MPLKWLVHVGMRTCFSRASSDATQNNFNMTNLISLIQENGADVLEKVRQAISEGVDVNRVTNYGESALRAASRNGRFDVVSMLLTAGADRNQLQGSSTIFEVAYGTVASVAASARENNDLESTDWWERTPFLFAVQLGDIEKAHLLLELGADRTAVGRCGRTPMQYAVQKDNIAMLRWLLEQGFDIESTDEFLDTPLITAASEGKTASVSFLITAGADIHKANHIPDRAIEVATNMDIVRILVSHGADINDISAEMHAELLGIEHDGDNPLASPEEAAAAGSFRFGQQNPEPMDFPFWLAMVRSGASAWRARSKLPSLSEQTPPVWSYQRFGRSTSILADGRIIEIAGEHEDHYDPDFCIYNDVTVFGTDGSIHIHGYPEDVFPPTDFHTATCIGDSILIIGCLGYPNGRQFGRTPVYRLDLGTFEIQKVETTGDHPGWIHRHKARLDERGRVVVSGGEIERDLATPSTDNIDEWILDPATWTWTRCTNKAWPQWTFARTDRKQNHLWQIRHLVWTRNANWKKEFDEGIHRLSRSMEHLPDLDSVEQLYQVPGVTSQRPGKAARGNFSPVYVDGIAIRLKESHWVVQAMVEGHLPETRLRAFKEGVLTNLARLEGVPWDICKSDGG